MSEAAKPPFPRAGADTQREARRLIRWLLVPVLALLAVLSVLQYRQGFQEAERTLIRRADERAQDLLAKAQPALAHVHDVKRLLEEGWREPPAAPAALRQALRAWRPAQAPLHAPVDGWTLDAAPAELRARWGQLWWGSEQGDAPSDLWLNRFALLQRAASVAAEREPAFEGTYFVSVERNVSWSYPWVDTQEMLRAMGVDSLAAMDALRIQSFAPVLQRAASGGKEPLYPNTWGQAYVSQTHGRLVQSHVAPVVVEGRYLGEVSVDFRLEGLQALASRWQEPGTRLLVVDRRLRVVADGLQPLQAPSQQAAANQVVEVPLAQRLPDGLAGALLPQLNERLKVTLTHAQGWVVLSAARSESPWIYVQALPLSTLRLEVLSSLLPNAAIAVVLLLVFVWGQWLFTRWFVHPALAVLGYLRELSADPATAQPQLGRRWVSWVGAVREAVEAQHRQRAQIERQHEALRQSERLSTMGTMLAGVAHELNNPLAIAMGRAALLEDRVLAATDADSPAAVAVRDDARRVREAAERCARIVKSFLNLARQRPPVRKPVQVLDVVRSASELLAHSFRKQGVQLRADVPGNLPLVQADPDQLTQVLLNLMINAQQAMQGRTGPQELVITAGLDAGVPESAQATSLVEHPSRLWLRLRDTGPGVPAALAARLFEPFFTTKEAGHGTGLGLSIARSLLLDHGGGLELEASDSHGSCFLLWLPVTTAAEPPAPELHAQAMADSTALARLLVADDDAEMADVLRETLEPAGYEVVQAESAAVVLELLAETRFDAVIADLHLVGLSGGELQQLLQERYAGLAQRTLFVTGDALSPAVQSQLQHLGRPSLEKPFSRDELLSAVRRLLSPQPVAEQAAASS